MLNALTFTMIGHHRDKGPGVVRPGGIYIRSSGSGEAVHEGPDGDLVPGLLDELIQWRNEGDLDVPNHVRAAMAHLNPVKVHPRRDGNGRMSRALQTLVLGRDRITTPGFCSIEEWLGRHRTTVDYDDVLGQRPAQAGEIGMLLEEQVGQDGLNLRCVAALYEVFVNRRVRRRRLRPYGETKGRFYEPGPRMLAIKADFARWVQPLRDPYR
ncbi:Fic family protein [Nonomuraea sp. SBT364]|uniref:Fic family protein n=1 Tax=Nonomuraea sp. SBT364 TaxID=1580530 RepID=UPI001E5614E8|nr:Fic family protein [Nonomuraea sp. SBT364]